MAYHFSKTLKDVTFDEVCERDTVALKAEGFGVLTQIDGQTRDQSNHKCLV